MHPYIVVVNDPVTNKQSLSIPCAESETAILVQKNLQSLFPNAQISVQMSKVVASIPQKVAQATVSTNTTTGLFAKVSSKVPSDDFSELERDLFEGVA